ncbi:MAG: AAA family ATPase, partial [Alphaproteobacteria bacterium]
MTDTTPAIVKNTPQTYNVVSMAEFGTMEIPERKWLLYPFIQEKSACMLFATRGMGKTFFCLSIALAVSTGTNILNFVVEQPYKVLYIDGEMNAYDMQERLKRLSTGMGLDFATNQNLFILTNDFQAVPISNLSTPAGQNKIEIILAENEINLVIIDNVSALCSHGRENEAESWIPMNEWIIDLRRRGYSVLIIDHAGKNQDNRGTSKKQDVMDAVVSL